MDAASRIETFRQFLRIKFLVGSPSPNVEGLRAYIAALGDGEASDAVVINSMSFEGQASTGQVVLEPMARLTAALSVLAEIDPDNTPPAPTTTRYADFSRGFLDT
jgi:hypothetical protein